MATRPIARRSSQSQHRPRGQRARKLMEGGWWWGGRGWLVGVGEATARPFRPQCGPPVRRRAAAQETAACACSRTGGLGIEPVKEAAAGFTRPAGRPPVLAAGSSEASRDRRSQALRGPRGDRAPEPTTTRRRYCETPAPAPMGALWSVRGIRVTAGAARGTRAEGSEGRRRQRPLLAAPLAVPWWRNAAARYPLRPRAAARRGGRLVRLPSRS